MNLASTQCEMEATKQELARVQEEHNRAVSDEVSVHYNFFYYILHVFVVTLQASHSSESIESLRGGVSAIEDGAGFHSKWVGGCKEGGGWKSEGFYRGSCMLISLHFYSI